MLADLDRPVEVMYYEPWNHDISVRAMSASEFVQTQARMVKVEDDHKEMIAVWSQVCAWCVVEPSYSAQEWASEASLPTLIDLGNMALVKSSKRHIDEAKKNLTDTGG